MVRITLAKPLWGERPFWVNSTNFTRKVVSIDDTVLFQGMSEDAV
jgi:hypothetical protein